MTSFLTKSLIKNTVLIAIAFIILFTISINAQNVINTPANILNSSSGSYGSFVASGFNIIPYFSYILILLGSGIAYIRSKKISITFLVALIVSIIIYSIGVSVNAQIIPVDIVIVIAGIFSAIIIYEIQVKHDGAFQQ